jgi:arginine decarboxylase
MIFVPNRVFFTRGVGKHKDKLQAFEMALRDAGIEKCNLVRVSSIFPPNCKRLPRNKGIGYLRAGQITFCVISENATNEPNRLISAAVGLAVPSEGDHYGYISEHHSFGETGDRTGDYSEDLAASMLASTLGIAFDPGKAYDERKETYKMSGKIVNTTNITQSAEGDKNGLWTYVMAAAVFLHVPEVPKPEGRRRSKPEPNGGAA